MDTKHMSSMERMAHLRAQMEANGAEVYDASTRHTGTPEAGPTTLAGRIGQALVQVFCFLILLLVVTGMPSNTPVPTQGSATVTNTTSGTPNAAEWADQGGSHDISGCFGSC